MKRMNKKIVIEMNKKFLSIFYVFGVRISSFGGTDKHKKIICKLKIN